MIRSGSHNRNQKAASLFLALLFVSAFLITSLAAPPFANASEPSRWRYGGSLGFGGSGIAQAVKLNGSYQVVERSEGPGIFSVFVDRFLSDYYNLAFEHSRGFTLGPFGMGSSFTGLALRYYFWGPGSTVPKVDGTETVLLVKRFTPYAGVATGVASAEIKRDNDLVSSVSGSGVFMGIRVGADYPMSPGWGLRPELTFSTTFYQDPLLPSTLSESSIGCGAYVFF
ncbi:hypothetical protein BH10BDE1_BH10BDE1_17330 [soil metagenome]